MPGANSETQRDCYENPLVTRYASKDMSKLWSAQVKFSNWRRLWLALAESEKELGVPGITDEALDEMRTNLDNINFEDAERLERSLRHDVMSHVQAWGLQCPKAIKIIHLGATSCFVTDNSDLMQMKASLELVRNKLLWLLDVMSKEAVAYRDVPTLGFTHFQPAQLTTVGKRITLWLHDLYLDFLDIERLIDDLPFRGVKGTTGTQASFMALFDDDHNRVIQLDALVTEKMGFQRCLPICGQTYTRKLDFRVLSGLSGISQSLHKMCTDIRLLASMKEIEEPFEKNQIGSSAMAYKRNPMRSERVCSIARYVNSLLFNTIETTSTQWLERTLDDSANRRICLPEAFLGVDAILDISRNIVSGLKVWHKVIESHINLELPFMATENILMACVKAGGDRQELHEAIRIHSLESGRLVKEQGFPNDLLERIAADPLFEAIRDDLHNILEPKQFIGRAPEQLDSFLNSEIKGIFRKYGDALAGMSKAELRV